MTFADVSDIEARWRDLSTEEEARATVLIDDASVMLAQLVDIDESDAAQADVLKIVCCNMVVRSMSATESDTFGVAQTSMTAGPYSQSFSFSNPSGDMYLTRAEKRLLGIGGNKYRAIMPHTWADDCHD